MNPSEKFGKILSFGVSQRLIGKLNIILNIVSFKGVVFLPESKKWGFEIGYLSSMELNKNNNDDEDEVKGKFNPEQLLKIWALPHLQVKFKPQILYFHKFCPEAIFYERMVSILQFRREDKSKEKR